MVLEDIHPLEHKPKHALTVKGLEYLPQKDRLVDLGLLSLERRLREDVIKVYRDKKRHTVQTWKGCGARLFSESISLL